MKPHTERGHIKTTSTMDVRFHKKRFEAGQLKSNQYNPEAVQGLDYLAGHVCDGILMLMLVGSTRKENRVGNNPLHFSLDTSCRESGRQEDHGIQWKQVRPGKSGERGVATGNWQVGWT